ncbi:hypothetical protein HBE96_17930 [Clostridium sp. P21]|uniref:Trigger factor n=1 Tax=Clostridium muellerianum TaxID=2716538 RepID=A0A7Y0EJY3_9CLOT|nr:hypothetical protein [Clostridium muellerianum]NMM64497.1 hypothetical protein [Clostridium muellerianum]
MFKSKVLEIYDFRNVKITEELLKIEIDKSEIDNSLMLVAKKNAVSIDADDEVKKGDQVIVEMESSLDKFNRKNLPIVVGMGLFNKSFEDELLGMKKNEVKSTNVDESSVTVKIMSIKRKVIPKVTNEMIKKLDIKGIGTIDEFKRNIYNEKVTEIKVDKLQKICWMVLDEAIKKSKFLVLEDDIEKLCDSELDRCRAIAKKENLVFEEMTKEQMEARVPASTVEEFREYLKKYYADELKSTLTAMKLAEEEKVIFDENKYDEYIKEEAKSHYKGDIEAAKAMNPFLRYISLQYSMYLYRKIEKYFETKFNCEFQE